MSWRQQQHMEQSTTQEGNQQAPSPLPENAVATGHLEAMAADLDQIKKKDQLFNLAIAAMAKNPVLSGGEKQARVLIDNIKAVDGQ